MVPDAWRNTPIVHLGPIAQEIDLDMLRIFPKSLIGMTPQGMLRSWTTEGRVFPTDWPEANYVMSQTDATIISIEDVGGSQQVIDDFAAYSNLLIVTRGMEGADLYTSGEIIHFPAPPQIEINSVGAGDIFATGFLSQLYHRKNSLEAVQFGVLLASYSVTRSGLESIPTAEEIHSCYEKVI
jgi:sugar/nucleoside kinase (ribokinase family)